jgi:hypothetical protein
MGQQWSQIKRKSGCVTGKAVLEVVGGLGCHLLGFTLLAVLACRRMPESGKIMPGTASRPAGREIKASL